MTKPSITAGQAWIWRLKTWQLKSEKRYWKIVFEKNWKNLIFCYRIAYKKIFGWFFVNPALSLCSSCWFLTQCQSVGKSLRGCAGVRIQSSLELRANRTKQAWNFLQKSKSTRHFTSQKVRAVFPCSSCTNSGRRGTTWNLIRKSSKQ